MRMPSCLIQKYQYSDQDEMLRTIPELSISATPFSLMEENSTCTELTICGILSLEGQRMCCPARMALL